MMEWAYVAGYFDGEGHVSLHPTRRGAPTRGLSWHNTHKASLDAIRAFIGAGNIYTKQRQPNQNFTGYTLTVGRKVDIVRVGEAMMPHLIIKADAVRRLIDFVQEHVSDTRAAGYHKLKSVSDDELRTLYESGLSLEAVARRYGVVNASVSRRLKLAGVPCRPLNAGHLKGRKKSEETKRRMRESRRALWQNPEFRAKQLEHLARGKKVA